MGIVQIPLSSRKYPGLFATIDEADLPLVSGYHWNVDCRGLKFYAMAYVPGSGKRGKFVRMHRLVMQAPPRADVDHRDDNGLHNTRENLRLATRVQNMSNQGTQRHNTSGYKGVYWDGARNRWGAKMRQNRKHIHIGRFTTAEEAARAYDAAAKSYHGAFARLNFPND